jgi:hypothetical protein
VRTVAVVFVPPAARAQGGPPLITDDPDTPGPGFWEINVAAQLDTDRNAHRLEAPLIDMNYGVGERIQLKLEMPWVRLRDHERDTLVNGAGNATAGVKWRFLGQEGVTLAWSIYPQIEFNTSHASVDKGIEDDGTVFEFPTEMTLEIGKFEINGEFGREIATAGKDLWIAGLSTEVTVTPRLEIVGEVHDATTRASDLIANIGARYQLSRQLTLLGAIGRTLHNAPSQPHAVRTYVGMQFNLPHNYNPPITVTQTHP